MSIVTGVVGSATNARAGLVDVPARLVLGAVAALASIPTVLIRADQPCAAVDGPIVGTADRCRLPVGCEGRPGTVRPPEQSRTVVLTIQLDDVIQASGP